MIKWYVDKLHVSTPDAQIAEDIGIRAINAGWGALPTLGVIAYALEIHHHNGEQYAAIMGGGWTV